MSTWVTYNDHGDWEGFLQRCFKTLSERRARDLLIDIRGNEGGTDVGDVILSYLVERDLMVKQFQRFTRYRTIPAELRPVLETWDRSFDDWGESAQPEPTRPGFYRLQRSEDSAGGTVVHPRAPHFPGHVWILVDTQDSSATFQFALAAKQNHLAVLGGEPTGGNLRGINGGAFYFLRFPHSHIEVDLPLIGFFPDTPQPDGGITPDVIVRQTAAATAAGRDEGVETVLARIGGRP